MNTQEAREQKRLLTLARMLLRRVADYLYYDDIFRSDLEARMIQEIQAAFEAWKKEGEEEK